MCHMYCSTVPFFPFRVLFSYVSIYISNCHQDISIWPSQSPKLLSLALSLMLHPTTSLFLQSTPWRNCFCNYTLYLCSHSIYLSLVFNPPHISLKQLSPKLLNDFLVTKSNGYILVSILPEQFPWYFSPGFLLSFVCPFLSVVVPHLIPTCRYSSL